MRNGTSSAARTAQAKKNDGSETLLRSYPFNVYTTRKQVGDLRLSGLHRARAPVTRTQFASKRSLQIYLLCHHNAPS
ncbi:hypothetical protein PoB_005132800 [Plakobranchus ocellatus]|uniref:Uncharacterized protein n=1 Tax=Plakobranchus ocellatus TaxID=259542 RepID=A0AAV4C1C6_9GAST|nr:hypothetical protein PoB_005132800 [Plakobranchus ocellatus]